MKTTLLRHTLAKITTLGIGALITIGGVAGIFIGLAPDYFAFEAPGTFFTTPLVYTSLLIALFGGLVLYRLGKRLTISRLAAIILAICTVAALASAYYVLADPTNMACRFSLEEAAPYAYANNQIYSGIEPWNVCREPRATTFSRDIFALPFSLLVGIVAVIGISSLLTPRHNPRK